MEKCDADVSVIFGSNAVQSQPLQGDYAGEAGEDAFQVAEVGEGDQGSPLLAAASNDLPVNPEA